MKGTYSTITDTAKLPSLLCVCSIFQHVNGIGVARSLNLSLEQVKLE